MLPPKMMISSKALLVASLIAVSAAQAQTIFYVNDAGDADNACTSWLDACPELQTALSLANDGDQIWVAQGLYRPDYDLKTGQHTGDREATFQLIGGAALYGGFDGTEMTLEDRTGLFDDTILTGDLDMNDVKDEFPYGSSFSDNSIHILTVNSAELDATLDGFTVTAGNANGPMMAAYGAGLFNDGSNPSLLNCRFNSNMATIGGAGVGCQLDSSTLIVSSTFTGNVALNGGGAAVLSGLGVKPSDLTLVECTFVQNTALLGGAESGGGGSRVWPPGETARGSERRPTHLTFGEGGALWNGGLIAAVSRCRFIGNVASYGGAIFSRGAINVTNSTFIGNSAEIGGGGVFGEGPGSAITNCIFTGNSAGQRGGGIYSELVADMDLTNNTFSWNSAGSQGGGLRSRGSDVIVNCIFWGNLDNNGKNMDESAQIHGQPDITYSLIQGLDTFADFPGNIDADPLFGDADGGDGIPGTEDDDLRLQPGSPCIDAAATSAVPPDGSDLDDDGDTDEPIPFDLDGEERFVDDPTTDDCAQAPGQCGECPVVDMGAYEFQDGSAYCCPADLDGDGAVGAGDLAMLLASWGPCKGCPADLDGNGQVDPFDLASLLASWGKCK